MSRLGRNDLQVGMYGHCICEERFRFIAVNDNADSVEYLGHTEDFKSTSKNYHCKKRVKTAKEERKLFRDTHPDIVDEHTFQVAQEIRAHRHRPTAAGRSSNTERQRILSQSGLLQLRQLPQQHGNLHRSLYPVGDIGENLVGPHEVRSGLCPAV